MPAKADIVAAIQELKDRLAIGTPETSQKGSSEGSQRPKPRNVDDTDNLLLANAGGGFSFYRVELQNR